MRRVAGCRLFVVIGPTPNDREQPPTNERAFSADRAKPKHRKQPARTG
jgi:hypothetical protein